MFEVVHDHECPYIPGMTAKTDYRLIEDCSAVEYQGLLQRGWRRFGCTFFRPICTDCLECRSLRLEVEQFTPSRSMKRTWKKNQDIKVLLQPVSMSATHLELYEQYHRDMATRRSWGDKSVSAGNYFQTFVEGKNDYGFELLYLKDDRLVGVALVDILPEALSAVYCYYAPDQRERGIGVFSVLMQLELARRRAIPYLYLGYWVEPNISMRYKSRYRPHELLEGRPGFDEEARWRPPAVEPPTPCPNTRSTLGSPDYGP